MSNTSWSFTRFRVNVLRALVAEGFDVLVLAPADAYSEQISGYGARFIPLQQLSNQGMNPCQDLRLYQEFIALYERERPDIIFQYTIKPNIYSTLAAKRTGIPVVAIITGLGYAFINPGFVSRLVRRMYRFALRSASQVWFLNADDKSLFLAERLVDSEKVQQIPGEGVDCYQVFNPDAWAPEDNPTNQKAQTHFLFIARLLYDKGIREYVDAARIIRLTYPNVMFQILGYLNVENPAAVKREELDSWIAEGLVDYLGDTADVRPFIMAADCIVLPSYREGMSMTLQESAAMAKPIIASNITGCKELIDDGKTGFLCEVRNSASLAQSIERFLKLNNAGRVEMGEAGRQKMLAEFAVDKVIAYYSNAIATLLKIKK